MTTSRSIHISRDPEPRELADHHIEHNNIPARLGMLQSSQAGQVAHPFLRAVVCMTAVRKDWGLNSPGSHTLLGVTKSAVHLRATCRRAS